MTDYEQLDIDIYDMVYKKYGKKYEVSFTGTTNPEWYDEQRKNKAGTGLEIIIKVKNK